MKKIMLSFITLVAILAVQAADKTDVKAKIQEINKQMVKAVLAQDCKTASSFYTEDGISMPAYEPMLRGKAAILKHGEDMAKAGIKLESFELTTSEVHGKGELLYEIGTYKLTIKMPGMPDPLPDHGKFLTIWEKQKDGSLKIKADIWNSDQNPWTRGKEKAP